MQPVELFHSISWDLSVICYSRPFQLLLWATVGGYFYLKIDISPNKCSIMILGRISADGRRQVFKVSLALDYLTA